MILQEMLGHINGGNILDIATGRGQFIDVIRNSIQDYIKIIGIDESQKAIDMAKESMNDDKIEFIVMDAGNLDFPDNSFDMVCLSNSLHHMEKLVEVFAEIRRVLKPDGTMVINEMICDNQTKSQLSHVKFHHFAADIDALMGITHHHTYTKQEIIQLLIDLGANIVDTQAYNEYEHQDDQVTKEELEENINYIIDLCDQQVARAKEHEQYGELVARAALVKDWVRKNGIDGATQVVVLAN